MSGWIRLDRRWHNTDGIKQNEPFCERAAWVWLISNAAWKETTRHGGKGDAITIQPGQIHVSDRSLATVFGWDKKRVRRFLSRLELVGKCHLSRNDNGTVLTLENWGLYQHQGPTEGPTEGPTQDRHGTTQEQGKQGKQETKVSAKPKKHRIPDDFSPSPFGAKTQSQKIIDSWHPEFFDGQLEKFRAHHTAKGTLHENWQSAWSTWVLNSRRFSQVTYGQEEVVVGI